MVVCVVLSFLKLECVEHSEPSIQQMILLRKPRSFITLMLKSFTNIVAIKQTCSLICHHSETWTLSRVLLCFYFHCSLPTTGTKFGPRCCCTDTKCNTHKHNKCNRHFATVFVLTGLYYDAKKEQWESIAATISCLTKKYSATFSMDCFLFLMTKFFDKFTGLFSSDG